MSVEKYAGATDRGTVLSTTIQSLADGAYSDPGAEIDNSVNKDIFGVAEFSATFGSGPTALSVIELYAVISRDGANYEQGGKDSDGVPPPATARVGVFQLDDTTSAQKIASNIFRLRGPFKHKFIARNRSGQTLPSSAVTIKLSTFNRDIS